MDGAGFAALLPREAALADARNRAGAHGADALIIDAHETWEIVMPIGQHQDDGRRVFILLHGRALRCP